MGAVLAGAWTVDGFLTWDDRQEGKHEFDGRRVVSMTGGSIAHQRIVANLIVTLLRLLDPIGLEPFQQMRIRCGGKVRYPDITVCSGTVDQSTRTLTDALAIFEVLSDDTATTDRVDKLIDYALLPSLRSYVLLEQTAVAATLFQREPQGPWVASARVDGSLVLPGLDIAVPLASIRRTAARRPSIVSKLAIIDVAPPRGATHCKL